MGVLKYYSKYNPSLLDRPSFDEKLIEEKVDVILEDVKQNKDEALIRFSKAFDNTDLTSGFYVTQEEFERAENLVPEKLKKAIMEAYKNIKAFHKAEWPKEEKVETEKGVFCSRKIVPIEKVGLYIPGGTAPLFSTVLMLAIPAKEAGCKDIILATPAKDGVIAPAILYAAKICGINKVLKVGGAQAIAAFAYGTESVTKRDMILGPGNRFVSVAKKKVQGVTSIDMIAGPSEVMVVVDKSANPRYAALDLLSQAEHGKDSQVILVILADKEEADEIYKSIETEVEKEIEKLNRKDFILSSLSHSVALSFDNNNEILDVINYYAPEHLIINTENYQELCDGVINAGSIFLGQYSPESAGDYASGTNHTLPTSGWAHSKGGVSLDTFLKKITIQRLTKEGITKLSETVIELADAEGLEAHREAARVRRDE